MESARPCGGCLIRFASACGRIAPALPPLVGESLGRIALTVSAADQAQREPPMLCNPDCGPWPMSWEGTGNRVEVDMRWGVVLLGY